MKNQTKKECDLKTTRGTEVAGGEEQLKFNKNTK